MRTTPWKLAGLAVWVLFSSQTVQAAEDTTALLHRQTQELIDAITTGTAAVWDRYLDPKVVVTAEDGAVYNKAQMLARTKPLPKGVSGDIKVTDFKVAEHGAVAIATYVSDEHEDYNGHKLHCQYRTTDTWRKTPAGWRLIASQVLALRTDPPAVPFTKEQIAEYSGRYALTPEITYEIREKDGGLVGQQTGRQPEALKAEAPDVLFVPGSPAIERFSCAARTAGSPASPSGARPGTSTGNGCPEKRAYAIQLPRLLRFQTPPDSSRRIQPPSAFPLQITNARRPERSKKISRPINRSSFFFQTFLRSAQGITIVRRTGW